MSQHGSSTTPVSATVPSQARTYGLKSVLIAMLVLTGGGLACWYFYSRLEQQVRKAEIAMDESVNQAQDKISTIKKRQEEFVRSSAQSQQEDRRRIEQLENERKSIEAQLVATDKTLKDLRSQQSVQSITFDQNSGRATELRFLDRRISEDLNTIETEYAGWNDSIAKVKSNGLGKQIATDPGMVAAFVALSSQEPVQQDKLAMWTEQADQRFRTIRAMENSPADVSPQDLEEVRQFASVIRSALTELRHKRQRLDAILKSAESLQPGSNSLSLQAAIEDHRKGIVNSLMQRASEEAGEISEELVQMLAAEKQKTQEELAKAEIESERRQRELRLEEKATESQKIADAIEAIRREEQLRREKLQAQLERDAREARYKAALPEINRYLVPFISPGNKQLNGTEWVYSDKKVPLSLSGLRASQALDNDQLGYQRLYYIAGGRVNDRPRGAFHQYIGGQIRDREIPTVRKAQSLLTEFGDLMVEKGLLNP